MDRDPRRSGGLSPELARVQQDLANQARQMQEAARQPFGVPSPGILTADVVPSPGQLVRLDGQATRSVFLPSAAPGNIGQMLVIKNESDGTATISARAQPGETIDGAATREISYAWGALVCVVVAPKAWVSFGFIGKTLEQFILTVLAGWPPTTDDPWEVTPPDWQNLTAFAGTPPSARISHTFTYDAVRNVHCMFAGYAGSTSQNDWWELDPVSETWSNPTPAGPPVIRNSHGAVYDPIGQRVLIFGGVNVTDYNDLIACDGSAFTVLIADGAGGSPSKRKDMGLAFDPWQGSAGELIMFGGNPGGGSQGLHDTWTCDMNSLVWTDRTTGSGLETGTRTDMSMFYDPVRRLVVMGGGHPGSGGTYDETWEYNNATRLWTQVTPAVAPKFPRWAGGTVRWHDMAWVPSYKRMAVIGHEGAADPAAREVLYLHDHDTPLWLEPTTTPTWDGVADGNVPFARYDHRITADPLRNCLYMFGGAKPIGLVKTNQLWRLSL